MNQMVTEKIFSYVLFLLLVSINLSNSLEIFMLLYLLCCCLVSAIKTDLTCVIRYTTYKNSAEIFSDKPPTTKVMQLIPLLEKRPTAARLLAFLNVHLVK